MEETVAVQADGRTLDRVFWILLTAGLLLFAIVTLPPGARHARALKNSVDEAQAVNAQLRQANDILVQRERALQSDPFYSEVVLRARMKYTRPGEREIMMPSTRDRRMLVDLPRAVAYTPTPIAGPGVISRVTSCALLAASGLLVAAAFIFFDRPAARAARPRLQVQG